MSLLHFKICVTELMNEMIKGLTRVRWERVDVKFGGGRYRLLAHNSIQVSFTYVVYSSSNLYYFHLFEFFTSDF